MQCLNSLDKKRDVTLPCNLAKKASKNLVIVTTLMLSKYMVYLSTTHFSLLQKDNQIRLES